MSMFQLKCVVCGVDFENKQQYAKYCGQACKSESNRLRYHAKRGTDPHSTTDCVICGKPFHPKGGGHSTCGSEYCKSMNETKNNKKRYAKIKKADYVKGEQCVSPPFWNPADYCDLWLTYRAYWCIGHVTDTQLFPMG